MPATCQLSPTQDSSMLSHFSTSTEKEKIREAGRRCVMALGPCFQFPTPSVTIFCRSTPPVFPRLFSTAMPTQRRRPLFPALLPVLLCELCCSEPLACPRCLLLFTTAPLPRFPLLGTQHRTTPYSHLDSREAATRLPAVPFSARMAVLYGAASLPPLSPFSVWRVTQCPPHLPSTS